MQTVEISGKICHIIQNGQSPCPVIYWGIAPGERDNWKSMPDLLPQGIPWLLIAYEAEDWNRDFSPWPAPAVFGRENFAGEADWLLHWLLNLCIPAVELEHGGGQPRLLGGYSLAGLFSLWAFYESGAFQGVACCSGSLWFPGWDDYMQNKFAPAESLIYLSLGDREEQTRNRAMARVGDATRTQYALACRDDHVASCTLEWNAGGHFKTPELRVAKGFGWLLMSLPKRPNVYENMISFYQAET